MKNKKSHLGLGIVIGSVVAGLAAYFLSQEENREMVKKKVDEVKKMLKDQHIPEKLQVVMEEIGAEGKNAVEMARKHLDKGLDEIKKHADDIDVEKYKDLVTEVMDEVSSETKVTTERLGKLKEYLMDKWETIHAEAEEDVKKVRSKANA